MTKTLISIVGPTGIGKTALSLAVAKHFKTEIISADSRQFFKEIPIGTAAPTSEELKVVPHNFIHHKSIKDAYSVGQFEKDAISRLTTLLKTKDTLVMVGGSGLYINAVINGLDEFPKVLPKIREDLNMRLKSEGILSLQEQLKFLDTKSYNTIAIDNPQRLVRALEICLGSGKPYSSFLNKRKTKREFKTIGIGLNGNRDDIYDRINKRVDMMIEQGLVEEAKTVYHLKHLNALNTVGYKELFKYFDGDWELDFAISEIKKNTRRFAKRQLTWFKKDRTTTWFDYNTKHDEIITFIESKI